MEVPDFLLLTRAETSLYAPPLACRVRWTRSDALPLLHRNNKGCVNRHIISKTSNSVPYLIFRAIHPVPHVRRSHVDVFKTTGGSRTSISNSHVWECCLYLGKFIQQMRCYSLQAERPRLLTTVRMFMPMLTPCLSPWRF